MTVTVTKPAFNLRDELSALKLKTGIKGNELLRANTVDDVYASINPTMFRNRFVNGAMMLAQRGLNINVTGLTGLPSYNYRLLDCHRTGGGNLTTGRYSMYQKDALDSTSAIYEAGAAPPGFRYSIKYSVDTAGNTSDAALFHSQFIEGQFVSDLAWGTNYAKPATLSFWIKSSIPGTYEIQIHNNTSPQTINRVTYNINSANTWEYKTISIPAINSGVWNLMATTAGVRCDWVIGKDATATWSGTTNQWYVNPATAGSVANTVSLMYTQGATMYITGTQFEVGSVATPFEHRPFPVEQTLCQRYIVAYSASGDGAGYGSYSKYGLGFAASSSLGRITFFLPVTMKGQPSLSTSAVGTFMVNSFASGDSATVNSLSINGNSTNKIALIEVGLSSSVLTGGQVVQLENNTGSYSYILWEAYVS
jgi:hypothetical protein